ncbi:MAG: 2-C-methyl-D-erythritol 2,4-cyclodiphosphate synthase [Candidatus Poribacteria bacterium]|nr:2-C-methyl-D-erythritol 2,4-cyclodiphosphate synthase [Candidatus Poribacteria bacterium]
MRVGIGYDIHRLVSNRKLILGGVEISYHLGLLGHSDADVLTHAIIDAILGAAALGDIGTHFPDTDARYEGVDSLVLLRETVEKVRRQNYQIENIDSTIIAQRPKLAPYILEIRELLAHVLDIAVGRVSVKATTAEELGVIGEGKAIAAHAVACLSRVVGVF